MNPKPIRRLYGIVQAAEHKAYCWGSRGKGLIASINFDGLTLMPCAQAECPHLDCDDTEPLGVASFSGMVDDGDWEVWLRKLKALGTLPVRAA